MTITEGTGEYELDVKLNNTIKDEISNFIHGIGVGKNLFNSAIIGAKTVEIIEETLEVLNYSKTSKIQRY